MGIRIAACMAMATVLVLSGCGSTAPEPTSSEPESVLDTVTTRSGPVREDIVATIAATPIAVERHRACMELAGTNESPYVVERECDFHRALEGIVSSPRYAYFGLEEAADIATGPCAVAIDSALPVIGYDGFMAARDAHRDAYVVGYPNLLETFTAFEEAASNQVAVLETVLTEC